MHKVGRHKENLSQGRLEELHAVDRNTGHLGNYGPANGSASQKNHCGMQMVFTNIAYIGGTTVGQLDKLQLGTCYSTPVIFQDTHSSSNLITKVYFLTLVPQKPLGDYKVILSTEQLTQEVPN